MAGGWDGSIARWDMGEQEEAVVLDFKKPRVVKCVGERLLVMRDEGELVSYKTSTRTLLWPVACGKLTMTGWSCVAWLARWLLTSCTPKCWNKSAVC